MSEPDRRRFLLALAAAAVAATASGLPGGAPAHADVLGAAPDPLLPQRLLPPPDPGTRVALAPGAVLKRLPGAGDLLAWTVDDGADTEVVRLYTQFAKDTGVRLTFFVTGAYRSWTDNATSLRPLVDSGQIQLANHTWTHPDLTRLSRSQIADELKSTDVFLRNTYGVDAAPYFRPPYGHHNPSVNAVAADLGYQNPTLWSGDLRDSALLPEDLIVRLAHQFFAPQHIVIGHLNHAPVTHVYGQLVDIIRARSLRTVTLNDVFLRPAILRGTTGFTG